MRLGYAVAAIAVAMIAGCRADREGDNGRPVSETRPASPERPSPAGNSGGGASTPGEPGAPGAADSRGALPKIPVEAPVTTTSAGTLLVGGAARVYDLVSPVAPVSGRLYPLVVVLHGDGGDGPSMHAVMPFEAASRDQAYVVYPSGNALAWDLVTPPDANADVAFLLGLVDDLRSRLPIDTARVLGVGFSKGAFMVNQVACRRSGLFRAIAPHSGGAPYETSDPGAGTWDNGYTRCAGQTLGSGPAVVVIHGVADAAVTLDSGRFTADYWGYIDGCGRTRSPASVPSAEMSACVAQDGCPANKPVLYCPIPDLGHGLWGSAAKAIWSFFATL